jgi:hypothetical protein
MKRVFTAVGIAATVALAVGRASNLRSASDKGYSVNLDSSGSVA